MNYCDEPTKKSTLIDGGGDVERLSMNSVREVSKYGALRHEH
jgi:hypothetical protein